MSTEPACKSRKEAAPAVHLFGDHDNQFVLDVHTNRLFSVTPRESEVLDQWLKGASLADMISEYPQEVDSVRRLQAQGLFCCEPAQTLAFGADWKRLREKIEHERYLTILELTQQCNLRCQYCVFGGAFADRRAHRSVTMSTDLLRMAVAGALAHGDALDEIALGFYGGEPLLAFELLQTAVRQVRANDAGRRVVFSLTTNGTCLDVKRAQFLRDEGFNVTVSVDGPREMHDRFRVFANGRGSYDATIQGLQVLLDVFGSDAAEMISLNMVAPSTEWLPFLEDFWESEPWVPRALRVHASIIDTPPGFDLPMPTEVKRPTLKTRWLSSVRDGTSPPTSLESSLFDFRMAKLHQRDLFASPRKAFFPNGCCIPGNRKVLVTADGEYRICERAYGVPAIGTVTDGVDFRKIKNIIDEYTNVSCADCLQCWAVGLCPLCFADAFEGGQFSLARKRSACEDVRAELQEDLALYASILDEFPSKAEEWEKYDLS